MVGLGNPSVRYDGTRHNLGFDVVDRLAEKHGISVSRSKFRALYGQGRIAGSAVVLVKPQTYMNLSGEAVQPLVQFFKTPLSRLLVLCDEFQLPLSKIRLRPNGSDGGHNGLKSLIQQLGTKDFPRLRMGCGPVPERMDPADFVLGHWSADERKPAAEMVALAAEAVESFLQHGIDRTMAQFN